MKKIDVIKWILFISLAVIVGMMISCTATKNNKAFTRVISNPELTNRVGLIWEKSNPCIPSVKVITHSDTLTVVDSSFANQNISFLNEVIDSLLSIHCPDPTGYNIDSLKSAIRIEVAKGCNPKIIYKTVIDSIIQPDLRRENILNETIAANGATIDILNKELSEKQRGNDKKMLWIIGLVAAIIGGIFLKIRGII